MYSDREPPRRNSLERRRRRSRSRSRSREREWDRGTTREWDHDRYRELEHDRFRDFDRDRYRDMDRDRLREYEDRMRYDRDGVRDYEHDRPRDLSYDRVREIDSLREREWDRNREWDRSRDRSRGYRSRSRSKSQEMDSERDRQNDKKPGGRPEMEITPVIMIRDVNPVVKKEHIVKALGKANGIVNDIRCVHRQQGTKGFAMLEFKTASDATNWMEENRDIFKLLGETVSLEYCRQRKGAGENRAKSEQDWVCFKMYIEKYRREGHCSTISMQALLDDKAKISSARSDCETTNFFRRRVCLTCDTTRSESDALREDIQLLKSGKKSEVELADEARADVISPSNVLIFKGLDVNSDEDSVRRAVKEICAMPLKDIRLIKDKNTDVSRGFCFVELDSMEDATELLQIIKAQYPAFFVDGRRVMVTFGRNMATNKMASAAIAQAQWSMTANALQKVVQSVNQDKASNIGSGNYPSTYSYDESSGFYYDSATGLYYDPKTQYHYNSETGLYCYYDSSKLMYISVDKDGNPIDNSQSASDASSKASKAKKSDFAPNKPPTAKQIAKDMERWSKKVNAAKTVQQQQLHAVIEQERGMSSEAPISFSSSSSSSLMSSMRSLDPVSSLYDFKKKDAPLSAVINMIEGQTGLSLQMGDTEGPVLQPSDVEPENPAHIDWNNMACLLCKRKFSSKEMLLKHIQLSELHKTNLAKEKEASSFGAATGEIQYRDRAKERRDKYGTPAVIPGWKKRLERELVKEPIPYEEPTKEGIADNNVGNKLLKAMGWSAGEGLGKDSQGIVDPIQAERRVASAGLGATGSRLPNASLYSSAGSYRETLNALTRARYEGSYRYD